MNIYGQAAQMGQASSYATPPPPVMQAPRPLGGMRTPDLMRPMMPAPVMASASMTPQFQPSPQSAPVPTNDGAQTSAPTVAGVGPSAVNMYADYLKNQQTGLSTYLTPRM